MLAEYRWQALAGASFAFRLSSGHMEVLRAIAPWTSGLKTGTTRIDPCDAFASPDVEPRDRA